MVRVREGEDAEKRQKLAKTHQRCASPIRFPVFHAAAGKDEMQNHEHFSRERTESSRVCCVSLVTGSRVPPRFFLSLAFPASSFWHVIDQYLLDAPDQVPRKCGVRILARKNRKWRANVVAIANGQIIMLCMGRAACTPKTVATSGFEPGPLRNF